MTQEHTNYTPPSQEAERDWNSYLQTIGLNAISIGTNTAQFAATGLQRAGRIAILVGGYSAVVQGQFENMWDSLDGRVVTTSTSLNSDIHIDGQFSTSLDNVGSVKTGGYFDKSFPIGGTFSQEILLDLPNANLAAPSTVLLAGGFILGAAGLALERLVKKKDVPVSPTAEISDTIESAENKAYYYKIGTKIFNLAANLAGMYAVSNIAFNNSVKKGEDALDNTFIVPSVQPFQKEKDFSFEFSGPDYTGNAEGHANLRGNIYAETNVDLTDIKHGLSEGVDRNGLYLLSAYASAGVSMVCQYAATKLYEQQKHYTGIAQELKIRDRVAEVDKDIEKGPIEPSIPRQASSFTDKVNESRLDRSQSF